MRLSKSVRVFAALACALAFPLLGLTARALAAAEYDHSVQCVNIDDLAKVTDLAAAGLNLGMKVGAAVDPQAAEHASVILWEAQATHDIDAAEAARLQEYVRTGGNLIISLDKDPGDGVFRIMQILPTSAWRTLHWAHQGPALTPSATGVDFDPEMFVQPPATGLRVPYFFPLRFFDTAERGQHRYERFGRDLVGVGGHFEPWQPTFTRPLLNRNWRVRVRADDLAGPALLLTGQYGAGKTAIFSSSAVYAGPALWQPLLQWLTRAQPAAPVEKSAAANVTATTSVDAAHRRLIVQLTNHEPQAVKAELVARILTWENALIGDVLRDVEIPAGGTANVEVPLPAADAAQYQALAFCDSFIVRVGALGEDRTQLLFDQRVNADLRPATQVAVSLDPIRKLEYPFHAPGYTTLYSNANRMGAPVMAYAYAPGAAVSGVVQVTNGLGNIAPLAAVKDETQPDNVSVPALTDGLIYGDKGPRGLVTAYLCWTGVADRENSLLFTFANEVTVSQIVLNGFSDSTRNCDLHNPGAVIVQTDTGDAASLNGLDQLYQDQLGLVHVPFTATKTKTVRVRFPWVQKLATGKARQAPMVGEIEIMGYAGDPAPAASGTLTVSLVDAMQPTAAVLSTQQIELPAGQASQIPFSFTAEPSKPNPAEARFYRVEAKFAPAGGATASTDAQPLVVIAPAHPLAPLDDLRPAKTFQLGFIVTRGFRNVSPLDTGTQDVVGNWGSPDDLVYAYEHQLKQITADAASSAGQLFATEANFKHYASPWTLYPNGEVMFDLAAPNFVQLVKKDYRAKNGTHVALGFSDRWDTGPAGSQLYNWQELTAFDAYLAANNLARLTGKTRQQLCHEVQTKYANRWSAWHMDRYAQVVAMLREAFAKDGRQLNISGQGLPLVPLKYLADLAQTIAGMSDDTTWGMWHEDIPVTTGREMAVLAFNPEWRFSQVLVPGYDSGALNGNFWAAAYTTEATRRHYFDPGWRGRMGSDGIYHSMHTYGYNQNGSVGWTMTLNDWQQIWRLQEQLSLFSPEAPIGAGVVVSNASWDDPDHATYSGGGMGGSDADDRIAQVAKGIGALSQAGIPIAFSSNVTALGKWTGNAPLILLDMSQLSASEITILGQLKQRGVHLAAFGGSGTILPAAADLFGIKSDGSPASGQAVATFNGQPVVTTATTLFLPGPSDNLDTAPLRALLKTFNDTLGLELELPDGMTGYGFTMGSQKYLVMEDWREQGRSATVRLKAGDAAKQLTAVNVDDHLPVPVKRDGQDWLIQFTTRPGDGTLLCLQEQ